MLMLNKLINKIKTNDMHFKKLILFAILAGVYTGVMALIPFFKDTSFADISISFEWWILFGVIIIMGSKSNLDAALKCFIFFLISQPIVYLVQVPFSGFSIFRYYLNWIGWTILTIPMGFIGYYIKKNNWLSLVILCPVLMFVGYHIYTFLNSLILYFPYHILSIIFCILSMILYVLLISNKKIRITGFIIGVLIIISCFAIGIYKNMNLSYEPSLICDSEELRFDLNSKVLIKDNLGEVRIEETNFGDNIGYCIVGKFNKIGKTTLTLNVDDIEYNYSLEVSPNSYELIRIE